MIGHVRGQLQVEDLVTWVEVVVLTFQPSCAYMRPPARPRKGEFRWNHTFHPRNEFIQGEFQVE